MTIAQIMEKMISEAHGNLHDINHFIRVWAYAKTIGELEQLDTKTQFLLEAAAIVHDIACPLCREKYGGTDGRRQEEEGPALVQAFFQGGLSSHEIDRIAYLVGHHHTYLNIDGSDYQILVEADFLVNAAEKHLSLEAIRHFAAGTFKTASGLALLNAIFLTSE